MRISRQTHKHRATEPVPQTERPAVSGAHRAGRPATPPMAGVRAILLSILTAQPKARD
ncbi:hypothetical protein L615_007800000050 [Nocardioides sp. J9]|uniref:hypothetical protein n=1 Tax=Nocardioides sp. J9 TaxID=935844 RepID=UPI0011AC6833|nr:hypothetical protein [Nocardioides sp. J9]TWG91765.1 hypothetical protein L615_007800000050 [Nocardioides sp. J9]